MIHLYFPGFVCLITFITKKLQMSNNHQSIHISTQALQEELAEEMKAKELEKHLAMIELGGAADNVQFVTDEEVNCARPVDTVSPGQEEEVQPAGQSRTSKPILPYSSLFCFGSDNRSVLLELKINDRLMMMKYEGFDWQYTLW